MFATHVRQGAEMTLGRMEWQDEARYIANEKSCTMAYLSQDSNKTFFDVMLYPICMLNYGADSMLCRSVALSSGLPSPHHQPAARERMGSSMVQEGGDVEAIQAGSECTPLYAARRWWALGRLLRGS